MFKTLVAFTALMGTLSAAVIDIQIEEKTQKPLTLTTSQINRIGASDGSIATIVANPNVFTIKIDQHLGQAFVTLKQPIEAPEGLTAITDSGYTQDFLVTSKEGEPTIVYLSEPPQLIETFQNSLATVETLSDIFEGIVPQGFGKRDFQKDEPLEVGPLLEYIQSVDVYEGAIENLYIVKIKSPNKKPLPLSKAAFDGERVNWIFSPIKELRKNEGTQIVISKGKD